MYKISFSCVGKNRPANRILLRSVGFELLLAIKMAIPLLNGQPLTLFTFAAAVHDEERALQFALALNMIPHELQCPNCLQNMGMQPKPSYKLGFRFRCKGCKIYRSPLANTFFENVKLPLLTVMQLLVMWFFRIPVTQAKIHAQIHRQTATDFYSFCREVCAVAHGHDEQQIGGPGDVVECDETHLFTPKYHRGRPLERSLWVFGGISRTTRKRFVVQIRAKDRDTLFRLMQKHIAQKSWVFTDEWRAYLTCESLGFAGHANVNHSRRFVNRRRVLIRGAKPRLGRPIVGRRYVRVKIHTNTCERSWRYLKTYLRNVRRVDMVQNHIAEYLYRTNTLRSIPTQEERFLQYIRDCVRVYPGVNGRKIELGDCSCEECEP